MGCMGVEGVPLQLSVCGQPRAVLLLLLLLLRSQCTPRLLFPKSSCPAALLHQQRSGRQQQGQQGQQQQGDGGEGLDMGGVGVGLGQVVDAAISESMYNMMEGCVSGEVLLVVLLVVLPVVLLLLAVGGGAPHQVNPRLRAPGESREVA